MAYLISDMEALSAEAQKRGTSYGKLMASTTVVERDEIIKRHRKAREARERRRKAQGTEKGAEREQCRGCAHWRSIGGGSTENICQCLSDTGKRKVLDGWKCLSRETAGAAKKRVCELAATDKTTLAGYRIQKRR